MVMMTSAGSGWHSDTETRAHWARASCSRGSRGSKYLNIVIESLSINWAQDFTAFIYSVEDMNDLNVYYEVMLSSLSYFTLIECLETIFETLREASNSKNEGGRRCRPEDAMN